MQIVLRIKDIFPNFIKSIYNSYSQIFFSNNWVLAIILICVSFFDVYAGISGLVAVVFSNTLAYLIGFNRVNIKSGFYGFNSLLVGLGLGVYYNPGIEYLMILLFASMLTLFVTLAFEGVVGKYGLPYLSLSFLIGIWAVTLASREFTALTVSERGVYRINEMYALGGISLVNIYDWFNHINLHESIIMYFKSIGAIFFQYHLFAGVLIAIGILIYSRISFLLSLIGFFSAYYFYYIIGADLGELSYSYIGFNFILTSIAIGGFFIIPSKYSFLWVILLTPLISIIIISTNIIFSVYQLSIYSLPFNIVVLLFLYALKFRERYFTKPELTILQQFSPEKNLYSQLNNKIRFDNYKYFPLSLPFWGDWIVSQGHEGEITHKEDWKHAWDFLIKDENGNTFAGTGDKKEDYYCYNKPLIAPGDGVVEEIINNVEDNEIGEVNLKENWGNSIIIKHRDLLYSQISHIKIDSFQVEKGDMVKKGDLLAYCGNSGRSPEPHVHMQIQTTPFIGSKTLKYPIGQYILKNNSEFEFQSFIIPEENDLISNIEKSESLHKAFHFIPGQKISFKVVDSNEIEKIVNFEVQADIYNNTFIYCKKTKSKAYFKYDNMIFYFTHFQGNKKSFLFYFYLGTYKVLSGFYKNLLITDSYPLSALNNKFLIFFQDFVAPFFLFMKSVYTLKYLSIDEVFDESTILLKSKTEVKFGRKITKKLDFDFEIDNEGIHKFTIIDKKLKIEAVRIYEEV